MRTRLKQTLTITSVSLCLLTSGLNAQDYWEEYGKNPVEIKQSRNGNVQTLKFVKFENNMLVAELEGGVGEIAMPATPGVMQNMRLELPGLQRLNSLLEQNNYQDALQILRPVVYPLVKFYQVPESFTQLHNPIYTLLETLIRGGEFKEAKELYSHIDLEKASGRYNQIALVLINSLIEDKQYAAAADLASTVPVTGKYQSNISALVGVADALRGAGNYEAVIPLYRSIENAVPESMKQNFRMWLAYSLVLAEQLDEATEIFQELEEPAPKDRLFSLYKLLQGSRAHREQDYSQALDVLTRGFVRAQTSYTWVPEMLYLIGDCYLRSSDNVAARNVWTEVVTLYPESPWAERSQNSMDTLPPAETANQTL